MATATSTISATPKFYFDEKLKFSKKETVSRSSSSSSRTTTPLMKSNSGRSHSHRRRCLCGFTRKCASLVKEQRARFYIMRRCVTMLICWRDYADS